MKRSGLFIYPLIILPGWLLTGTYLYYEYMEYDSAFLAHMLSTGPSYRLLFHLLILSVPFAAVAFAYYIDRHVKLMVSLRELEGRYRDYYDNAPYGYHSADGLMTIIEVNDTWLRMLGYEAREVVGIKKVTDLMAAEGRKRLIALYPEFKRTGLLDNLECEFIRKDGMLTPVLISSTAVYDEEGRFVRSRTIVKDNTERKAYEQVLRAVAEEWEVTFNAMPWGVMIVDGSGNVLRHNDYFQKPDAPKPEELGKLQCCELMDRHMAEVGMLSGNGGNGGNGGNARGGPAVMDFDYGPRHYSLMGRPVSEGGVVSTYVFSLVDITDIRKGERRLMDSRNAFFNMLKDVSSAYKELDQVHTSLIFAFANAIDAKSPWTKGHSERVTRYAVALGEALGYDRKRLELLKTAALLHDIGKIGTYDSLLNKPARLTSEEYEVVKLHPEMSAVILEPISRFGEIVGVIKYHHEHYDGSGYPYGLKGEEIPPMARILCIADSYDSMTADRPYRNALGLEYAISELRACSGTHFDPAMVEVFIKAIEEGKVR